MVYPNSIERLIVEFSKLPGIGRKTAERLTFFCLRTDTENVSGLGNALLNIQSSIHLCPKCFSYTDKDICDICKKGNRDHSTICVVEDCKDLFAVEKTNEYKGLYHVLHGTLSPLEGRGPKDIKIRELLGRLKNKEEYVKEVIMATNASPEGESTASYIASLIKPSGIKVTRLAKGMPIGNDIEFADPMTILKAIEYRNTI